MNASFHFRPELLHAIELLEFHSRKRLASAYTGNDESPYRGSGMQFKEFRQYEFGDDIRHISWSTTARTGKTQLKLYEEEREINVFMLVDTSGSSLFGSTQRKKIDMYSEVLALMSMASLKANFRFGALFFDTEVREYIPPTRDKDEILSSLNHLISLNLDKRQSDIRPALQFCGQLLKHRTLVIALSDFLMAPFSSELVSLGSKHELILLQGYDDSERLLSSRGVFEVCDPETGEFYLLDSESGVFRKTLANYYSGFTAQLEELARACQADFLPLSVQDDYLQRLVYFFRGR